MVTVLTAASISGKFEAVSIIPQFVNCSEVTGTGVYTVTTLTVTVVQTPCSGGVSTGLIIGLWELFGTGIGLLMPCTRPDPSYRVTKTLSQ